MLVTTKASKFSHFFVSFFLLGGRNASAKRVTRAAQQHICHVDFLNTLSTGNHLRSENTRIVSDHHRLPTITTNKISLSGFDKHCILPVGIKTLPFGHYENCDYAIDEIDSNNDDVEWDYDDFSD